MIWLTVAAIVSLSMAIGTRIMSDKPSATWFFVLILLLILNVWQLSVAL